jgi:elongator complex protein 3
MRAFAPLRFDPASYQHALLPLLAELMPVLRARAHASEHAPLGTEALRSFLRRYPKDARGFFSRAELIAGLRAFAEPLGVGDELARIAAQLRMRPVRTQSGVTPITVLTKPFPCPGECVFCPNDVRMPKSYLSREPGAQRAEQNGFDPYLQTYNRLLALGAIGHAVAKAELIILGGTFSFYPEAYQRWFIARCFMALNDYGAGEDRRREAGAANVAHAELDAALEPVRLPGRYNRKVTPFLRAKHGASLLHQAESCTWDELHDAQRVNEAASCRNVGVVIETRPDHVTEAEALRLRRLGCTKIQLGVQSLHDETLRVNRRGHDVAAVRRAMRVLRQAGFKVLAHYMPNLLGSTPALDVEGARLMFDDPDFRPDELKIYPCSLVETADLMQHYAEGRYRPYEHEELLAVLADVLAAAPRYCRLSRVVRDISSCDIVVGNRMANLRELAEARLRDEGRACADIRNREIRQGAIDPDALALRVTAYESGVSRELFIELCDARDRLAGFVRLSLPTTPSFVAELGSDDRGSAVIRELHVYGASLALGSRESGSPQHNGLGQRLVGEALQHARAAGYATLSVISAVGTRPYYRRLGFRDGPLYQHRSTEA